VFNIAVTLRQIENYDLENIMRWRMAPEITRYMNTDPELTIEGQRKWLLSISNNPDVRYWMIEVDNQPAGVINLTGLMNQNGNLGWAYYMGEQRLRSMKIALSLEMSMYDYVFKILNKNSIIGDVFSLNAGVITLHKLCGCEIIEEKKHYICKNNIWYDVTFMRMTKAQWLEICDSKKYEKIDFGVFECS
jgi:UDP-4-amino-4,6-dideoxy-N-acetyl-beta-L-altrosamine N-acetyltransferase